jgi:cell division cycle protein 20 (cofactor of APC complex)
MSSPVLADRSATVFKTPTTSSRCSTQGGAWTADGRTATTTPAAARTPRRPIAGEFRTPRSRKRTPGGDRFIPSRSGADLQFSAYTIRSAKRRRLTDGSSETCRAENGSGLARTPLAADPDSARRREKLFALRGRSSESRVLNIKQITASAGTNHNDAYWKDYSLPTPNSTSARKAVRKYPKTADKILDAPNLIDDFYLNVMDWSQRGTLAIAMGGVVYLLDAETSDSSSLCSTSSENNYVSSLQWNKTGQYLAVGDSNADIQLWDVDAKKLVRTMRTHDSRVNALAWNPRTHLLSSASQSGNIHNYDIRQPRFHVGSVDGRSRDICGLRWSPSGRFLASGGDGNLVCLWDTHSRDPWTSPSHVLREHTAAVKVSLYLFLFLFFSTCIIFL